MSKNNKKVVCVCVCVLGLCVLSLSHSHAHVMLWLLLLWHKCSLIAKVGRGVSTWCIFFFFLWLCWVFVSVRGLSPVAASRGHSSSRCAGLSLSRPLLLRSTGSRRAGSVIVAHGPSHSAACGILPDQGSNPRPLHWQADSQPLRHQGSPYMVYFENHPNNFPNEVWNFTIGQSSPCVKWRPFLRECLCHGKTWGIS